MFSSRSIHSYPTALWLKPALFRDMISTTRITSTVAILAMLFVAVFGAQAHAAWKLDTRGATGPIAQIALPIRGEIRRTSFVVFEHSRQCDPIFSFAEIVGSKFETPIEQSVLRGSKIGLIIDGKFHTWHAAITKYSNGYEAGFGVTNELYGLLTRKIETMEYVTPHGERIHLPLFGFRRSLEAAAAECLRRQK